MAERLQESHLEPVAVAEPANDASFSPRSSVFQPKQAETLRLAADVMPGVGRHYVLSRLASLLLLAVVGYGLVHAARAGYHYVTDAQVAPIILSPDSDLVIPSRLSLAALETDRQAVDVRIEAAESGINASEQGIAGLQDLRRAVERGLTFSSEITSQTSSSTNDELLHLSDQRELLQSSIAEQEAYIADLRQQLAMGLIGRSALVREQLELSRLRVSMLQTERDTASSQARLQATELERDSLGTRDELPRAPAPQLLQQREQLARIDLEVLKLQADTQAKRADLRAAEAQAERLDRLIEQIRARPIYRALEQRQDIAFVPYTQLAQVVPDAPIYDCRWLAMFACEKVGKVIEIIPGEIAATDPWGSPARGQYALLNLADASAAKSKVLRVRPVREESAALASLESLVGSRK